MNLLRSAAFLVIALILFIVWLVSWTAFHVAGGLIHLLLVIAVIAVILHFVRGGRRSV
jgi:Family of unknown function (DUF5670)